MFDFARKGLYVGLGLANATKEKIESFAREFAKEAKLTEDEGRKLAQFLHRESKKAGEGLKETVDGLVEAAVKRMPCRRGMKEMEARIAALEMAVGIAPPQPDCCCSEEGPEQADGAEKSAEDETGK